MSKTNKGVDKLAALAAMRKQAVADEPPVINATPPPSPTTKPLLARSATADKPQKPVEAERERTAVNLTGRAVEALKQIQSLLITEGGGTAASLSATMCIALEYTAEGLPKNKQRLIELITATRQTDKRRRAE